MATIGAPWLIGGVVVAGLVTDRVLVKRRGYGLFGKAPDADADAPVVFAEGHVGQRVAAARRPVDQPGPENIGGVIQAALDAFGWLRGIDRRDMAEEERHIVEDRVEDRRVRRISARRAAARRRAIADRRRVVRLPGGMPPGVWAV